MKIAIIGCGTIAGIHARAIKALGHTISLAVDRDIKSAKAFSEKWNIESVATSLSDEMLSSLDCVHICTPPTTHYDVVEKCLLSNTHVICEKPLSLSVDESKTLMKLAKDKNLVNAVNFNVRFYDACQKAHKTIHQDEFGKPILIQCSYQQEFHALPEAYSWRYRPEISGHLRATSEIGSHCIDLIRFWTDLKISEVSANFGHFTPERHIVDGVMYPSPMESSTPITVSSEDAAIVSLKFNNGAIGSIIVSEVSHGRNNHIRLEVVGGNQSVWWESETPFHLNTAKKGQGISTEVNAFSQNFNDTIAQFIENVYSDISSETQHKHYPDFYDGYINTLICEAIHTSAINNSTWVKIEE